MDTSFQSAIAAVRAELCRAPLPDRAGNDASVVPGLYLSWDDTARVEIALARPEGGLLALDARIEGRPEWLSLNIAAGEVVLTPGHTLGLIAALAGPAHTRLPVVLRSGLDGETDDTPWDDGFDRLDWPRTQVLLQRLDTDMPATRPGAFHTLMIHLPAQSFRLEIRDLAAIVRPTPARGPHLTLAQMAGS